MPPTGYLSSSGIESCLQYLANTYPAFCQLITLPETSVEGRPMHAVKIGNGTGSGRHGMLILGGVHARELVPPDALVSLALRLCQAYAGGTGLTFGSRTYSSGTLKLLVEGLDSYLLPQVNPDGRSFVQAAGGDAWWRKNRRPSVGGCVGVDLNRNFDILWSSGIGTSADPCEYQIYRGSAAFSEPETRNVKALLDSYPEIECMLDIHSYSELFLYPWGDAPDQSTDPNMNFHNPAYDGQRGVSGSGYGEYIPQVDRDWLVNSGAKVRDAIAAVRGHGYLVEQSIGLYPTSGTSDDYAYSRHFVDPAAARVYASTLEIGLEFQPTYSEALVEMDEVASAVLQFAIQCMCAVTTTALRARRTVDLSSLRRWRERLGESAAGRRYLELVPTVSAAFLVRFAEDESFAREAVSVLIELNDAVATDPEAPRISGRLVDRAIGLIGRLAESSEDEALRRSTDELAADAMHFRDRSLSEGLELASRGFQTRGSSGAKRHRPG